MTNPPIQMERFLILPFILLPAPIAYNNRAKVAGAAKTQSPSGDDFAQSLQAMFYGNIIDIKVSD